MSCLMASQMNSSFRPPKGLIENSQQPWLERAHRASGQALRLFQLQDRGFGGVRTGWRYL